MPRGFSARVLLSLFFGAAVFWTACSDDDAAGSKLKLIKIGETTVDSAETTIRLYAEDSLCVGYNRLYISLETTNDGYEVDHADLTILPQMNMTDMAMVHSCPFEAPSGFENGYFKSAAVFSMPSYDMGFWSVRVDFHNHYNDKQGTAVFDLQIANSSNVKTFTSGTDKYIMTLIDMNDPVVGLNDFEIGLYKKQTMMNFPPVTNAAVSIEPTMPSMAHGSSNNVNPVHTSLGHYLGKVNFTMTGDWQIDVNAVINDTVTLSTHYDVTVR